LRSSYFPDGRVDKERYESDLSPSFVASVSLVRELLLAVFREAGAIGEADDVEARSGNYVLRYGPGADEVQVVELPVNASQPEPAAVVERGIGTWLQAVAAARDADHAGALRSFEQEALDAVGSDEPQRAAVAFRSAAAAARATGRGDDSNRLLRLAGKAYLEIAESRETGHQGVFLAYREAARCLLEAGNLPLAQMSLGKAMAIVETLGYTEMAAQVG
jgi:hypothetical protein